MPRIAKEECVTHYLFVVTGRKWNASAVASYIYLHLTYTIITADHA